MDKFQSALQEYEITTKPPPGGAVKVGVAVGAAPIFTPGTVVEISVPITNRSSVALRVFVGVNVYEGSIYAGAGTLLEHISSTEYTIPVNGTYTFKVRRTEIQGSIDRRDVGVEVNYWNGTQWVTDGTSQFDDVYFVQSPTYQFEIGQPTAQAV